MQTIASVKRFIDRLSGTELDDYVPDVTAIGSGIYRTAYRYGDYVIKRRATETGAHEPRSRYYRVAKAVGFELAPTTHYKGYAIQRYYTPPARWGRRFKQTQRRYYNHIVRYGDTGMDFHSGNIGWNKRTKKIVVFDW